MKIPDDVMDAIVDALFSVNMSKEMMDEACKRLERPDKVYAIRRDSGNWDENSEIISLFFHKNRAKQEALEYSYKEEKDGRQTEVDVERWPVGRFPNNEDWDEPPIMRIVWKWKRTVTAGNSSEDKGGVYAIKEGGGKAVCHFYDEKTAKEEAVKYSEIQEKEHHRRPMILVERIRVGEWDNGKENDPVLKIEWTLERNVKER